MLSKQTIRTSISDTYNVVTGCGIIPEMKTFVQNNGYNRACIVVDGNVLDKQPGFIKELQSLFSETWLYKLEPGEQSKSLQKWTEIIDFCLSCGIDRQVPLLAAGGGVTGDLAGFAASTVLRGIPLIHIPTTLLAMVDSAIGGKTGVNHESGKNLIGTFYQPKAVFSDLNVLETLPDEEFICGFGEILKYGAIADPVILDVLKTKNLLDFRENISQLEGIIQRCIKIKADIVSRDTRESAGRAFLNYGHTFAHAIEKKLGYGTISHGQAVYIGMIAAGILSVSMGGNLNRELLLKHAASMKVSASVLNNLTAEELIDGMKQDKKRQAGSQQFVLLQQYGRAYLHKMENMEQVSQAWSETLKLLNDLQVNNKNKL